MAGWIRRPFTSVSRVTLALAMFLAGMGGGMGLLSATAQDEGEQIFACVNPNSGEVKIVDESTVCNRNEEALVWNVTGPQGPQGEPPDTFSWNAITDVPPDISARRAADVVCTGCVDTVDIRDDAVNADKLALDAVVGGFGGPIKDDSITSDDLAPASVRENELALDAVVGGPGGAVKDGTITADDLADDSVGAAEVADGAVSGGFDGAIEDGTITADDLDTGSVTGDAILDDTITADDLGTGSVTSDAILDGTISGNDVQDHSLTTLELDANVAISESGTTSLPASTTGSPAQELAFTIIDIPGAESHVVLINGYIQISCQFGQSRDCGGDAVGWYVTDGANPVNSMYTQSFVTGDAAIILPVTLTTILSPGQHTLKLMAAYISPTPLEAGIVSAMNVTFAAVDLGGAN